MKQNRLNRGWQVFFPDFRRVGVYPRIREGEAREEGFYWVVLGQNPPEIAY